MTLVLRIVTPTPTLTLALTLTLTLPVGGVGVRYGIWYGLHGDSYHISIPLLQVHRIDAKILPQYGLTVCTHTTTISNATSIRSNSLSLMYCLFLTTP